MKKTFVRRRSPWSPTTSRPCRSRSTTRRSSGRAARRQDRRDVHRGVHDHRAVRTRGPCPCLSECERGMMKGREEKMLRKTVLTLALASAFSASAAWAQDSRVEISGTAGWTFSDGVSGGTTTVNGEDFSRIDPKDAFSWGARIGFFATPNVEIGALFSQQATSLEISGLRPRQSSSATRRSTTTTATSLTTSATRTRPSGRTSSAGSARRSSAPSRSTSAACSGTSTAPPSSRRRGRSA